MPSNSISGSESEKYWKKAKAAADEEYPGLKASDPDRYYATVMSIYKNMCKNNDCSPKAESMGVGMSVLLERLERWKTKPIDWWQLFSFDDPKMAKKAHDAVADLNGAMSTATKKLMGKLPDEYDEEGVGSAIGWVYRKYVKPVQKDYVEVGALDTEPSMAAIQWLIDAVKKYYGIKGRTDIADYI